MRERQREWSFVCVARFAQRPKQTKKKERLLVVYVSGTSSNSILMTCLCQDLGCASDWL